MFWVNTSGVFAFMVKFKTIRNGTIFKLPRYLVGLPCVAFPIRPGPDVRITLSIFSSGPDPATRSGIYCVTLSQPLIDCFVVRFRHNYSSILRPVGAGCWPSLYL